MCTGFASAMIAFDYSGLPNLESIPDCAFGECRHLVSVVFGVHSNITKLGVCAFQGCSALKSIILPNKLKESRSLIVAPRASRSVQTNTKMSSRCTCEFASRTYPAVRGSSRGNLLLSIFGTGASWRRRFQRCFGRWDTR